MLTPRGQILLTKGLAGKFRRQQGLDVRQGIEPSDERPCLLAVLQAAIDRFLDGHAQASDFTFGSCIHNF